MSNFKKLSHVIYRCTYHIVWTPKYRYRILDGLVKELLSKDIGILLEWKGCELKEMNIQRDHIHLIVSVPPKLSISKLMGILKGKSHQNIQKLSSIKAEALLGQPLLVTRILCWHSWTWWRKNQEICPVSRRSRTSRRAATAQLWPLIGATQAHLLRRWII